MSAITVKLKSRSGGVYELVVNSDGSGFVLYDPNSMLVIDASIFSLDSRIEIQETEAMISSQNIKRSPMYMIEVDK